MRVLYTYLFPLWGNGSGAWLRRLTHQLTKIYPNEFEAAIVAPDRRKLPSAKIFPITPPQLGVFVGNPELLKAKKFADWTAKEHLDNFTSYVNKVSYAVEKFKPDIIHTFHTAFLPPVARTVANFYNIPFIFTTHGSDLYYFKEDHRWSSLMRSASDQACFITANSDFTKNWYLQLFGQKFAQKTKVIPAGIDNNVNFQKDVSWIDKKYRFTHKRMVLFTGRLIEHKGVDYLIMAAEKIKAEIVIIGDGPERSYLEKLVKKHKLDNVHILGYMPGSSGKIEDFYLRADVYVAPSVWKEPLGLVLLEAMVHKTPVIVTQSGGVTTMVKDGENGFLVYAKRSDMIAKRVNLLLEDDAMRSRMGENAYKTVVENFNWDKIAGKFWNIYQRCASGK